MDNLGMVLDKKSSVINLQHEPFNTSSTIRTRINHEKGVMMVFTLLYQEKEDILFTSEALLDGFIAPIRLKLTDENGKSMKPSKLDPDLYDPFSNRDMTHATPHSATVKGHPSPRRSRSDVRASENRGESPRVFVLFEVV
ncbi:hypothetical protein J6590_056695 [Homalodisca vitripennis]|nr:hypothetical protein J6590_056695 [Homalodisca vitripennis]